MTFNDLLRDLSCAFMGSPTVVNAYKELEKDPRSADYVAENAAERTTIPAKAVALSRAVANIEAGIAQVRAERTGKEADIQSFVPDYDPALDYDVAAEIAEMARGKNEFDHTAQERGKLRRNGAILDLGKN